MKKKYFRFRFIFFTGLILIITSGIKADNYCGSLRYDSEVFQNVQTTSDIIFGSNINSSGASTILKMDFYEPIGDTLAVRPLIIWVHGGSFVGGTKNDADITSLCQHFAKRGYVCASIEYRLGFSVFPPTAAAAKTAVFMAVQDMKAAVRYFRKDAATTNIYGIDPDMIFGGGSSAGAFTALHLAYLNEPSEVPIEIDTTLIGGLEGNSGNPGYVSTINAVINLCGALGDKTYLQPGDIPVASMHGDYDGTVPFGTATIYLLNVFPVMIVDGSYSLSDYANTIGLQNEMYTFYGADHVPYLTNLAYMDTTVRFVSNFLYRYLGCIPSDPTPIANTFTTNVNSEELISNVSVYPNPSTGKIWIELNDQQNKIVSVSLQDISGRNIIQNNSFENPMNIETLIGGMYLLLIETDSGNMVKKIVIK